MKKTLWIIPLTLLLWGCNKDINPPDRSDTDMAANGRTGMFVKTPLKVNFYAIPDLTQGFVDCIPTEFGVQLAKKMNIGGTATHFGKLQMANSYLEHTMCYMGPEQFQITAISNGLIMAANGDIGTFVAKYVTNAWDMTFTGTVTMTGGTGRFEGCSGEVIMTGSQDVNTMKVSWMADGFIMMKKK
ncbi:MAG: hypothetical protein MUE71_01250 [Chitinophagaceae bacterium]|jgi:hypothetical protein|nr:hypothetical protein [Chitinophagaceae bacterium]